MIDRERFYPVVRRHFGRLRQAQVDGFEAILAACERDAAAGDERWASYILATAWHETGGRMEPVRETFAATDQEAVDRLMRTRYGKRYAFRHEDNGNAYYGRGFVQLTWRDNYRVMGQRLDLPLDDEPDLALEPGPAAAILVVGMVEGRFTGRRLDQYFTATESNTVEARRIVNGLDRAHKIAGYARKFYAALRPPPM